MITTEKVTQAIIDFVKGGDTSDADLLDRVLHKDFRVTNNGFMGTKGVAILINKHICQTLGRVFLADYPER